MEHFVDQKGEYYTGDKRDYKDLEVTQRPSPYHKPVNGEWMLDREAWLDSVIRPSRNELLNKSDITYCNADKWELMTEEQKATWRVYKQALRDLPDTVDYSNPVWPAMPTV